MCSVCVCVCCVWSTLYQHLLLLWFSLFSLNLINRNLFHRTKHIKRIIIIIIIVRSETIAIFSFLLISLRSVFHLFVHSSSPTPPPVRSSSTSSYSLRLWKKNCFSSLSALQLRSVRFAFFLCSHFHALFSLSTCTRTIEWNETERKPQGRFPYSTRDLYEFTFYFDASVRPMLVLLYRLFFLFCDCDAVNSHRRSEIRLCAVYRSMMIAVRRWNLYVNYKRKHQFTGATIDSISITVAMVRD